MTLFVYLRSLNCEFTLDIDQMKNASQSAKNLIKSLLKSEPTTRLTATECLHHQWIKGTRRLQHQNTLIELETSWMRKCLARRRWYRAMNALEVVRTMRKFSSAEYKSLPKYMKDQNDNFRTVETLNNLSCPQPFEEYKQRFQIGPMIGAGAFGNVFQIRDNTTQVMNR